MKKQNLLLIFTRNPELGKCKTRLAAKIGDKTALDIYKFLLNHTAGITKNIKATVTVYYSNEIWEEDIWNANDCIKKLQKGRDLGERMANAFTQSFDEGYKNVIIIGSDMFDLNTSDIDDAFKQLEQNNYVIGPAEDGGYYLLGMKKVTPEIFKNKVWGTETVLKNTLDDIKKETYKLLKVKNDVDYYEDIKDVDAFQPFLKNKHL
ncbi:MAG: TIGR04282 family arsenosugar biosynthesis glycosyltransferase [Cellulophaga sp.]